jgi:hypothetical protein
MTNSDSKTQQPTHNEIADRAYQLWEASGRQPDHDQEYWYQAIAHLTANKPAAARRDAAPAPTASTSPANPPNATKTEGLKKRKPEGQSAKRQPAFA